MKQILLFSLALCAFFCSCSNDNDDQETVLPKIKFHKNKIGVGQYIIGSCKPLGNDTLGYTYAWDTDNGTIKKGGNYSSGWIPDKKGNSKVSVTVTRKNEEVRRSTNINVVDCNFELALWYDHMADVIVNEFLINDIEATPEFDPESGLVMVAFSRNNYAIGYVSISTPDIIGGIRQTTKKYGIESDKYVYEYNEEKERLIKQYGEPETDEIIWKSKPSYITPGNENSPMMQGVAIGGGFLVLEATFNTPDSKITVTCKGERSKVNTTTVYFSREFIEKSKTRVDTDSLSDKIISLL